MRQSSSLFYMRREPGPIAVQSKSAAAVQRQLDKNTAATVSNTSLLPRSAGERSPEEG